MNVPLKMSDASLEERIRSTDEGYEELKAEKDGRTVPLKGPLLWKIAKTLGIVGASMGVTTALFSAPWSPLYMSGAFAVGHAIEYLQNKKADPKTKFSIDNFLKDIYTGALFSPLGLEIYSFMDGMIPTPVHFPDLSSMSAFNSSMTTALARLGIFSAVAVPAYIYAYRGYMWLRDKVGWERLRKSITGIKPRKLFEYIKDAHKYDIAKNAPSGVVTAIKNFAPIWLFSLNGIKNVATRLVIGNINDVVYRLFIGGQNVKNEVFYVAGYKALRDKMYMPLKNRIKVGYSSLKNLLTGIGKSISKYTLPSESYSYAT